MNCLCISLSSISPMKSRLGNFNYEFFNYNCLKYICLIILFNSIFAISSFSFSILTLFFTFYNYFPYFYMYCFKASFASFASFASINKLPFFPYGFCYLNNFYFSDISLLMFSISFFFSLYFSYNSLINFFKL
jgi:hypothetical protein